MDGWMMKFVLFRIWQRQYSYCSYVQNVLIEIWQAEEQKQVLAQIYRSINQHQRQINPINPLGNNTNIWKIVVQEVVWLIFYVTNVRWFYILAVLWLTCECWASWIGCNFKIKACGKDDERNLPWLPLKSFPLLEASNIFFWNCMMLSIHTFMFVERINNILEQNHIEKPIFD